MQFKSDNVLAGRLLASLEMATWRAPGAWPSCSSLQPGVQKMPFWPPGLLAI
jgi:hypothetical protein